MALIIYNTLSQKKQIFKPRQGKKINLFVCGPTVYDFPHLGHARTYIVFDVIVKYLRQFGFDVFYLQNITDIDDKIINRAKEENVSWKILSRKFEKKYLKDMQALGIDSVSQYARATKHIKQIVSQVKRLLKSGFAYQIEDGIYYNIKKFKDYGKLSKRTALQAEDSVSRIDEAKEKRNKGDFCLWKKSKPGEPYWQSPWFLGRPGWHIEDTAITEKYFGPQYDIHGGARDLIFPHHEAEISQMEAISGKSPLVKYWLHTGFLTVKGKKMAKSLGNFITIQDFLKRGRKKDCSRFLRFIIIKNHYRSPLDYNETALAQSRTEFTKIIDFIKRLKKIRATNEEQSRTAKDLLFKTKSGFQEAMDDDLNTPKAVAEILNLTNKGNYLLDNKEISLTDANNILEFLFSIDKIFGFNLKDTNFYFPIHQKAEGKKEISLREIKLLAQKREKYRQKKQWQKADEARREIKEMGYLIEDTKEGPKIKKL